MTSFDVVVSGHLCIDLLPGMDRLDAHVLTTSGRLYETDMLHIAAGGCVSNAGSVLHRLGVNVGLIANVGDDALGRLTIEALNQHDPALGRMIQVQPGGASSYSVVLAPGGSDRTFLHHTGTNATFSAESIDYALLQGVKLFHLGYPPVLPALLTQDGEGLAAIFRRVKALGVVTSLDMCMPDANGLSGRVDWGQILRNTLPHVDVFLPSLDEIVFMLRRDWFDTWEGRALDHVSAGLLDELAAELHAMGVPIVGFKLGHLGFYLRTQDVPKSQAFSRIELDPAVWSKRRLWQPSFNVVSAGTTGAGDAAYAGFIAALLQRHRPAEALKWACAVGAFSVEAADATSGIQTIGATLARLGDGWEVRPERLPGY